MFRDSLIRIWVKLSLRSIYSAIEALNDRAIDDHTAAVKEPDEEHANALRAEADKKNADAKDIRDELRRFESGKEDE